MPVSAIPVILHYTGGYNDGGGIVSVVRALAAAGRFECVLGVNPDFQQRRAPVLAALELPPMPGEQIGLRAFWRGLAVADAVQAWLHADERRVFHGHSRAGLVVALWLHSRGEARVVASVHCYGRQRWFYRWAARRLRERLFWLSPTMKHYYGVDRGGSWTQCMPGCVRLPAVESVPRERTAEGIVRIGGAGALVAWKGWHLVLEALVLLPETVRTKLRFVHIGGADGSAESARYAATLHDRAAALNLDTMVEWRGPQPSSEVLLAEIDALIVASACEPFSVAMLEALAAGVPVLAADSGGSCDIIDPTKNGWLFRSGDAGDLARMLAGLVESGALAAARPSPQPNWRFEAGRIADEWAEIYRRVRS